ncbi:hypothetical protein K8S19_05755 [bacterium]|nr:hypothetical protein [bacterium]
MKTIRILFSLFCVLLITLPVQARRSPGQDWQTTETEHFIIIYPQENAAAAGRVAVISENYYPKVKKLFGYAPPGKTPIVLNNRMDFANGYAQSIFRKMEFYLTTPDDKTFGPDDPSWLESLFIHEYAHLCQGMRHDGFSAMLTTLFGEVAGMNYIAPRWWVEGVAVYAETTLARGGRGENNYQHMKLAANLLSEHPWSLGQVGVYPKFSLPPDRVYIPGFDMITKLQSLYQKDNLMDVLASQQSAWPFFGLGYVWHRQTGYGPGNIWKQVQAEKRKDYAAHYGKHRLPMPDALEVMGTESGFYEQPRWTRRATLLVYQDSLKQADAVVEIDPRTNRVIKQRLSANLRKGRYAYDVQKDHVLMARMHPDMIYQDAYLADLYEVDAQGRETRLTKNQRCWSPAVAPDGTIACIVKGDELNQLAILDKTSGVVQKIRGPRGAHYASPSWSPQGNRLAVSIRINGVQDICLIDPQTNIGQSICGWDKAADWDPVWSPDNQYVLFVSDRSGTHQIYAYHLEDKKLFKVTDAYLGAFDPAVSWDMKLIAFAEYRPGNTQRIMLAPFHPAAWQEVALAEPQKRPAHDPVFDVAPAKGKPYSALPHLLPSLWLPMVSADEAGLIWGIISGKQDVLENQQWIGQILYQPDNNRIYGNFSYTYSGWPAVVAINGFHRPGLRYGLPHDREDTTVYWSVQQGVLLSAVMTFLLAQTDITSTWIQTQVGYDAMYIFAEDAAAYPGDDYTGMNGTLTFQSTRKSAWDLFPTAGFSLTAMIKSAMPQKAYDGRYGFAEADFYIPSPIAHHAIGLGVRAATKAGFFPKTFMEVAPQGYYGGQFNLGTNLTWSMNYRFPIVYLDKGPGLFPMFFHDLWAELFVEQGAGWDGKLTQTRWEEKAVVSAGLNVHLDTELFWYLPARISQRMTYVAEDESFHGTLEINLGF